MLLYLVGTFLDVIPPQIIGSIIDYLTLHHIKIKTLDNFVQLFNVSGIKAVLLLTLLYAIINLCSYIFSAARGYYTTISGEKIINELRAMVFTRVLRMKPENLLKYRSGDLVSRILTEPESLRSILIAPVIDLLSGVLTMIWALYFALRINLTLSMSLMLFILPVYFISHFFSIRFYRISKRIRDFFGIVNAYVFNRVSNIVFIKAYNKENFEKNMFMRMIKKHFQLLKEQSKEYAIYFPMVGTVRILGYSFLLGLGSYYVYSGKMTAGELIIIFQYLPKIFSPLLSFSNHAIRISQALASIKRVVEVLNESLEGYKEIKVPENLNVEIKGDIFIDKITFSYGENHRPIFKDFTLKIRQGEHVAIYGESGSGKTTLTLLLLGFLKPQKGEIYIDGKKIEEYSLSILRSKIGLLFQQPFLIEGSIRDNLLYLRKNVGDAEIKAVLRSLKLWNKVKNLPNGIDTYIGERGEMLSGGEKQRLCLARLLLSKPQIVILDEPTANLDRKNAEALLELVSTTFQDKTVIYLTHDEKVKKYVRKVVDL